MKIEANNIFLRLYRSITDVIVQSRSDQEGRLRDSNATIAASAAAANQRGLQLQISSSLHFRNGLD